MKKGGRGKEFEGVIREAFDKVPNVSVTRLKDDIQKFKGAQNPCDFIVYHKPYLYAIECKSVAHGNTLPFTNITDGQWKGLAEMNTVKGVYAGIICWWSSVDVTKYIPIKMLLAMKDAGEKSISWERDFYVSENRMWLTTEITGRKKRVYFEYDMQKFLDEMEGIE